MGNLESPGEAVEGGLISRSIEPYAGEADAEASPANCLNCDTKLNGPYCQNCGQKARANRSLRAFFHDLLHGALHFEEKIWRTLLLLVWRPGELTRAYIDGQRARFVSPIALFLFCVFLMFAVGGLTGDFDVPASNAIKRDLAQEVNQSGKKLEVLQKQRREASGDRATQGQLDAMIAEEKQNLSTLKQLQSGEVGTKLEVDGDNGEIPDFMKSVIDRAQANPELLVYKLKTNAYKLSWALIPISAPFLWLLFPFSRQFHLYDHTVFVTYSLCFMSLLAIVAMLLGWAGLRAVAAFLLFVQPVHMYRQLKGTYGLGRFGALWRTVLLTLFAFCAAALFVSVIASVGAAD